MTSLCRRLGSPLTHVYKIKKMTVSLKPLCMPLEAYLSLSLKPSLWMFIRLAPGDLFLMANF